MNLLDAIEEIEVSLKTQISYILGKKYGAYGYLNFNFWVNRKKYSKYIVEKKQYKFKEVLLKILKKTNSFDLKNDNNHDADGFPTVWLAMDAIMFGGLVTMLSIMGNDSLEELSKYYHCSGKELVSWVKCLNFIRNICAHNSNVIDVKLFTTPIIRKEWRKKLCLIRSGNGAIRTTNRIAIAIYIIVTLVNSINNKYKWDNIQNNLCNLCDGIQSRANIMGFVNANDAINLKNLSKSILK